MKHRTNFLSVLSHRAIKNIVWVQAKLSDDRGQGMVEYGLIIALIAVVLIGALTLLGGGLGNVFKSITTQV